MNASANWRAPKASVVICCYADARWNDVGQATRSALAQNPPPYEIILVVDHNPTLEGRLRREFPHVIVAPNREASRIVWRAQHGHRGRDGRSYHVP